MQMTYHHHMEHLSQFLSYWFQNQTDSYVKIMAFGFV